MVVSHNVSFSSPLPSGMAVVMISPVTVVPLHRGEAAAAGLSQLLQSLSSKESTVNGVQEKCLVRLELVRFGRPTFVVSDSRRGSENRLEGVGVWSLLNVLAMCGRDEVTEARIVSLSRSSPCRLEALLWTLGPPLMGSSPTATWRRSSTNVQRPALKSSAICFTPLFDGEFDEDRGVQVARFDIPLAARGCRVRFWKCGSESFTGGVWPSKGSSRIGKPPSGLVGDNRDRARVCPPRMTRLRPE